MPVKDDNVQQDDLQPLFMLLVDAKTGRCKWVSNPETKFMPGQLAQALLMFQRFVDEIIFGGGMQQGPVIEPADQSLLKRLQARQRGLLNG